MRKAAFTYTSITASYPARYAQDGCRDTPRRNTAKPPMTMRLKTHGFCRFFKYNQYFCSAVIDSNALHRTIQPYDKNTAAYGTYNNKDRHKGLQIRRA